MAATDAARDGESAPAPESQRLRLAVVVQRFGADVNGGAELHARLLVQRLCRRHEVTVLTSRARDYTRWDSDYAAGADRVDGVAVLRFDHPPREAAGRARVPRRHRLRYRLRALLAALGAPGAALPSGDAVVDGVRFLERQGPHCPALVEHLATATGRYDVVLAFTALYHPTALGLLACPLPAVLVPTLHDERPMYLPLFHRVFRRPERILWNCEAERRLAARLYGDDIAPGTVCGVGVDVGRVDAAAIDVARRRHGIDAPYFVFVGRITAGKGFPLLARAYARIAARRADRLQLVVVGQEFMKSLPRTPGIVYTGFVDDADRDALIAGALGTVVTSGRESLSLVTLESMALGTPVVVNGRSEVLRGHVDDSGAGLAFGSPSDLPALLERIVAASGDERNRMRDAGRRYVRERYGWDRVEATLLGALAAAAATPRRSADGGART